MKAKILYLALLTLLFNSPLHSQAKTEIITRSVVASWNKDPGDAFITLRIAVKNPYLYGHSFKNSLRKYYTHYINGKIVSDTISSFPNADWGGTERLRHVVRVAKKYIKPNVIGKIVLKVDNNRYYRGNDKSVPKTISFVVNYKITQVDGKMRIDTMKNYYPDGSQSGNDFTMQANSPPIISETTNTTDYSTDKELAEEAVSGQSEIRIENNPATGKPWKYIASEGNSFVGIDLSLPGVEAINYTVENNSGSISSSVGNSGNSSGTINLLNGKGKIYYYPPINIPESKGFLTTTTQQGKAVRYYPVKIHFTYTDADGNESKKALEINYCRPPVILVHGFTGDKSTWELLERMLVQKGYMTQRSDYYARNELRGSMDIGAQSFLLEENIKNEIDAFRQSNLMCSYVDIVSHSMGGLIARHYSTLHPRKGKHVRKIIMVGTPNHGIYSAIDLMSGKAAAYFSNAHRGMAQDVDASSRTMRQFNIGEHSGSHINGAIEYGNIYVDNTDGVVQSQSARLNGVSEVILSNMKHSPAIPDVFGYGSKSITTDFMVFGKILHWLNNPIPKASLNMNKWDVEYSLESGKEYDLSGNGHILKVISGTIKINTELKKINANNSTTAQITYPDGSVIKIKPRTKLSYNHNLSEILLHMGKTIYNLKKQGKKFMVITPSLRAGVLGTCFEVSVKEDGSSDVYLYSGELEIENLSGRKTITTSQLISSSNENSMNQSNFSPESRFKREWLGLPGMSTLNSFIGNSGPLFSKVVIGGESMVKTNNVTTTNCLGKLKLQFIVPVSGSSANARHQAQMKILTDRNNWERKWFNDAQNNFKKGVLPQELTGTYRPNQNGKAGTGKYYSETVTLFTPMKIREVNGEAEGFRIVHGNTKKENYFSPIKAVVGTVLECGSYKLYVNPNEIRAKSWVTIKLEAAQ